MNEATTQEFQVEGERIYDTQDIRCPSCGHMPHPSGKCLNIASDNDCDCAFPDERVDGDDPWCKPCASYHPYPQTVEHWRELGCKADRKDFPVHVPAEPPQYVEDCLCHKAGCSIEICGLGLYHHDGCQVGVADPPTPPVLQVEGEPRIDVERLAQIEQNIRSPHPDLFNSDDALEIVQMVKVLLAAPAGTCDECAQPFATPSRYCFICYQSARESGYFEAERTSAASFVVNCQRCGAVVELFPQAPAVSVDDLRECPCGTETDGGGCPNGH